MTGKSETQASESLEGQTGPAPKSSESVKQVPANAKNRSPKKLSFGLCLLGLLLVGLGVVSGMFIPQNGIRPLVARWLSNGAEAEEKEPEADDSSGIFDISIAAQNAYGMEFSKVEAVPSTYIQHVSVPAFVRERPATSNLQASCRMDGIVRRIFVQVGQSVREGDPMMELELTGDALASAQATLLDSVQQLQIIDDEIARLRPAAQEGIARKSLIAKEYEKRRMSSVIESKRQELLVRGLTETEVNGIIENKRLVRSVIITVPTGIRPQAAPQTTMKTANQNRFQLVADAQAKDPGEWVYSVESMKVSPGSVLSAGQAVSDLAYHETLLIEGQAYERDLGALTRLINQKQTVSVEVGDSNNPVVIDDLKILYMDNHVDNKTQTYRFYIEVPNSVLAENIVDERRFRTWRFKPGQRGHVRLPESEWTDKLVLPADAVAEDGVDHVLFRRVSVHDHFHGDVPPHSEFKKLVVEVLYKDQYTVVVDHREQLTPKQTVALNNADMLLRAMSESGGHSHSHDHGHEH